ncbi:MAG TPA: hypothetical protein VH414_19430, partial [Lichenihabitans sp.]|nr:hypothetical protein [Lichenihabitans sp.]
GGKFAARVPGVGDTEVGAVEALAPLPVPTMVSTRPFDLDSVADAPREEDGIVPKITSSAHSLWSMTASAGGSLLSRLIP